jgi:hypothetical protein
VYADAAPPALADAWSAVQGHVGEAAHDRIERICTEEGVPYSSAATYGQPCGPQPIADAVAILRDAETVAHGMLTELRDDWGFGYVSGDERYNLDPALTIDLSTYRVGEGDSAAVLVPSRNDKRIRNEWTVSRPAGSEATVIDADHQARHGRYNDAATVSMAGDEQLEHDAGWRVHEAAMDAEAEGLFRWLLCEHEAAHAVAAAWYGLEIESAWVDHHQGHGGTTTRIAADPMVEAVVAVAGSVASQSRLDGADLEHATAAVGAARIPDAISEARIICSARSDHIQAVAAELRDRGRVDAARLAVLLEDLVRPGATR